MSVAPRPKRPIRYPKAPTMSGEKPPGAPTMSDEGMSVPLALYRAHRIPEAGHGETFTKSEGKRKSKYPPVPNPETEGFKGTPGDNKLNMFHGTKSVFVARTKQQAINFMNEVTIGKSGATFGIYKVSNTSEYDIVRVEPSYSKASKQASIARVSHAYKQVYANAEHLRPLMRAANKRPDGQRAVDAAMKKVATAYVDGPARWNGEHVVKGDIKPEHVTLVAKYKIDNNRAKTSAPTKTTETSQKGNRYPVITTRQDQVRNHAEVKAAMATWQAVKKNTPEEVKKAAELVKKPPRRAPRP